ncbi:glycosyltransferase family 2 protein [Persephonella sp.]
MELLSDFIYAFLKYVYNIAVNTNILEKILLVLPYLVLELPFAVLSIILLTLKYRFGLFQIKNAGKRPDVSVIVTAYSEGEDVKKSILSLMEQKYEGFIEIIVVVDGAKKNKKTLEVARRYEGEYRDKKRKVVVIPKWERGGRASSLNIGLIHASCEIVFAVDGDTSFDVDMVKNAVKYFSDSSIVAVSGNLRIRNWNRSLVTRFQSIEYSISIYMYKQVLDILGFINNVSGAFGIFRKEFIRKSGWDAGSAEDLDLTLRLKKLRSVHKNIRFHFAADSIGLTDGPETWKSLLKQRQRWDGDLVYLFLKKHRNIFNPLKFSFGEFIYLMHQTVLQQFLIPVFIVLYYIKLLSQFTVVETFAVMAFIYLIYVVHTFILFSFFVLVVSERKKWDIRLIPYTFLYPMYGLLLRLNAFVAYIDELFFDAHKRTPYIPRWVAKRLKF